MLSNPFVSIIINNFNYGGFIREAIDSALHQSYPFKEVIVVDDGSTDDSKLIIDSYEDKIIPIYKNNGGQSSALNAGFSASRGDIICFLDADDAFLMNKIEVIVNLFNSNSDIVWCFHLLKLFNIETNEYYHSNHKIQTQVIDYRSIVEGGNKLPLSSIPTATSGLCFRRGLLQDIFPLPACIQIASDNYLKFLSLALNKGIFLSDELSIQKIHSNNLYTLRNDNQDVKLKTTILTAYCLRVKYPSICKFSNGLFVLSLAHYWFNKEARVECNNALKKYLSLIENHELLWIFPRACFCYLKLLFNGGIISNV